jgi:hypothetical protein
MTHRTTAATIVRAAVALLVVTVAGCIPETSTPPTSTTTTGTTSTSTTSTSTTSTTTTTTVPPTVAITASTPASPSTSESPLLSGYGPVATTTIRLFPSADCSGGPVGSGSAATFTSPGIGVTVGLGTTTQFTALATGPGTSACSPPFTYVNTLTPPNAWESEPNDGVLQADPIAVDVGAPAEISAHLDGPGVSDLFVFTVEPGRSIRIETFDRTGLTCDLVDTHIYLAPLDSGIGGNDDDGGIGQCSLLAPGVGTYGVNLVAVAGGDYVLNVQGSSTGREYRIRVEVLP